MTQQELSPPKELLICPPQRILVVEDDPAISLLIVKLLEHNWFYTVSKCNGSLGADAFDPNSIDLLITDLQMAGGGGIELIKKVRAKSDLPIIIVTAYAADYANEVRFLDNVTVINKPFDGRQLLKAVDRALPLSPPSFEPTPDQYDTDPALAPFRTATPLAISPALAITLLPSASALIPAKKNILIADNDPAHLLMLAVMLKSAGYTVISASSVTQAVQLAVEQNPDLLLLDIHMGEDDGYAIQERLEKFDHFNGIPVIYITGDQSNWTQFTISAMGAHALLRKPFDRIKLLAIVENAFA